MIYPWQKKQWQQLWLAKKENRLPHALLLNGIAGLGKFDFAKIFIQALFCQQVTEEGQVCNHCHACRLALTRAHPNVLWIEPEKEGQAIKIDQVRDINEFVNQSSFQGEYRIVIIHPADAMNPNAANALLKTLEEPSAGAILMLISHQIAKLPSTVLSRCQRIVFPSPSFRETALWLRERLSDETVNAELLLRIAQGAPLAALQLANSDLLATRKEIYHHLYSLSQGKNNPLSAAVKIKELNPQVFLNSMLSWLHDILTIRLTGETSTIINSDYVDELKELTAKTNLQHNAKWVTQLQQFHLQITKGYNLNKQLMFESIFIQWVELCT